MQTSDILAERRKTHGEFADNAKVSQAIKAAIRSANPTLTAIQWEALDHIAGKIGRICAGNPNEPDHWRDIAGFATLVADRLPTVVDHPELPFDEDDDPQLNPGWKYAEAGAHTITGYDRWVKGKTTITNPVDTVLIGEVYEGVSPHRKLVTPNWHGDARIDPEPGYRLCVVGETRDIASHYHYGLPGYRWHTLKDPAKSSILVKKTTYRTLSNTPLPPVFKDERP